MNIYYKIMKVLFSKIILLCMFVTAMCTFDPLDNSNNTNQTNVRKMIKSTSSLNLSHDFNMHPSSVSSSGSSSGSSSSSSSGSTSGSSSSSSSGTVKKPFLRNVKKSKSFYHSL